MQNEANWTIVDSLDMWGFTHTSNTMDFKSRYHSHND